MKGIKMNLKEFFGIALPKWPAMVVRGTDVTAEQAGEIIIRTDRLWFSHNDAEFARELYEALGVELDKDGYNPNLEQWNKAREKYRILNLEYLHNAQIVSSYIGGPHGWCNWSGEIRNVPYNIGKWPGVGDVYEEWKVIAKEFPYLNLRCQLFDKEYCEDNPKPVVEFVVKNGKVIMKEPKEAFQVYDLPCSVMRFIDPWAERGCTIEMFKKALELVRKEKK